MDLMNFYMAAYSVFSQTEKGNCSLDEVFDERPDWQPPQQTSKALDGRHLIILCSVLLMVELTYLVQ